METTLIAETLKEIIHEVPVKAKVAFGAGLLLLAAIIRVADRDCEVSFSFKSAR